MMGTNHSLKASKQAADAKKPSAPTQINLDQLYEADAASYFGKPILDLPGIASHLDTGLNVDVGRDDVITYAFSDFRHQPGLNNSPFYYGEGKGYSAFNGDQRIAARTATALWDDLVAPRFVEAKPGPGASSWGKNNVDIWFANTSTGPAQAWAYYPEELPRFARESSDVWIADPSTNWTNRWFSNLGYGNTTLVHELGHSLGLSHPGSYDYVPNVPLSYANNAEYAQDSSQYTIMSYWGAAQTGARIINWAGMLPAYAQTPMLHDVYAIQKKYGADSTTRAGDTVYGFNSTAGRDVFDFTKNAYPFLTIYDAAGKDTIDLSGFTASQFIDLHPGSFSSVGDGLPTESLVNSYLANLSAITGLEWGTFNPAYWGSQMQIAGAANELSIASDLAAMGHNAVNGIVTSEYQNLSIAYGVTIENAIGGSSRDLIWGNQFANELWGMGGDDVLNGFEGADKLYGGAGNDVFVFSHVQKGDRIMDWNGGDKIDLREIDANGNLAGAQGFHFIGNTAFSGIAGELHYANGVLEGDVNGDRIADFSVVLVGSPSISGFDFNLV